MNNTVILKNRRFTCLSPTLVRIEFAPDGKFEGRRSLIAYATQEPIAFAESSTEGVWSILKTDALEIRTRQNDLPCDRNTLEIRWSDGRVLQFWRPGDRDYQNLGGTLRSLDRYGGDVCALDGVHPAIMESPDISGTSWPAWIQCEVDPLYKDLHPAPPEKLNAGSFVRIGKQSRSDGLLTERTFNWYKEARRFCPGVLSESGYFLLNDSDGAVLDADDFPVERERPGIQDWYFFGYGTGYKQALRDFRLLSGPAPIPTHRSLGIIFSRWPAFTEDEIKGMVRDFAANGYPLSTLVMDMEWHTEGWGTWDINPELIPDPERFFALCKQHGLEVSFNDHPLDVREDDSHYDEYVRRAGPDVEIRERDYNGKMIKMAKVDITNKMQNQAFRAVCETEILDLGLDYWWNDGSRGQMRVTSGQLVANKSFFEDSERDGKRGMLLARYGGLGSHRYGAFFTGDANSDWHVIQLQCEFNIRAAGVGLSHVSHDIGGFMVPPSQVSKNAAGTPVIDRERYVRWLQFGVFSPILRFHCAPSSGSRLPYDYDESGVCRHWLRVRHSLLPYLYTAAEEFRRTGIPLTRGLFLEDPENGNAYRFDEYFFGPDLFVAPVLEAGTERTFLLPAGEWWEFETANKISGGAEITRPVTLSDVPVYVRAGGIIPRQDPDRDLHAGHIAALELDLYPGAEGEAFLYEDDGRSTDYLEGGFCRSRFVWDGKSLSGEILAGAPLGTLRKIVVIFRSMIEPAHIALEGSGTIPYERLECGFRISLPELPADLAWKLNVAF